MVKGGEHLLRTFKFIISLIFHTAFEVVDLAHAHTAVSGAIRNGGWVSETPKPKIFPPQHTVLIARSPENPQVPTALSYSYHLLSLPGITKKQKWVDRKEEGYRNETSLRHI